MRYYKCMLLGVFGILGLMASVDESEARARCNGSQIYRPSIRSCVAKTTAIKQGIYRPKSGRARFARRGRVVAASHVARTRSVRYTRSSRSARRSIRYSRYTARPAVVKPDDVEKKPVSVEAKPNRFDDLQRGRVERIERVESKEPHIVPKVVLKEAPKEAPKEVVKEAPKEATKTSPFGALLPLR